MPNDKLCPECGARLPESAPGNRCPKCLLELGLVAGLDAPDIARTDVGVIEKPGDRIGRYKLLQKLGEGGAGIVYMAEQEEPVRRRVALKVIKLGMDTRSVIARFEAERQVLALMDHPNIARVLDAGASEAGRPYFVMELVRGIKITHYCDQNNLSTGERLDLFLQICRAIQHAHQKGIIHRDIKPSNILVTLHDGVPVPKVIDFGIAKATTGQRLTDKTLYTAFEQFIGTPAYMSPEQAEMSGLDIDTRSDIYSMGVPLYELLTGKTPFDAKELFEAGLDEMRRVIREDEPARPSTRLSTMLAADLATVAQHRHAAAAKLIHNLRGDLDWIVMKTLEKDRTRRYETVNGLAMDIQRHLCNEPVVARPPGRLYRFQKMARRNKLAFAAAGAVAAALVIGLGLSTWQFIEKSRAYQRAVSAEHAAERARADEANQRQQAVEARNNEAQLRKQAEATGTRLAETFSQLALQRAEELFASGDSSTALAYLSRVLRQNLTNEVAAERTLFALTGCNLTSHSIESPKREDQATPDELRPNGQRGATMLENNKAQLLEAKAGQPLTEPLEHEAGVESAQFSPDGQRVVTASLYRSARVWDARTGMLLRALLKLGDGVRSARFSPNGQRVVTASGDNSTRLWDTKTGRQLTQPLIHEQEVWSAEFSPDGQRVVTASQDKTARIWDVPSVSLPVPAWVPKLAEAIVEKRFNDEGVSEPVPPAELLALRRQLSESSESDIWTRCAKWLFADPAARTISPFSAVTVPEYVQHRIQENTLDCLQEAVKLAPTNSLALARLARAILAQKQPQNPRQVAEADWYSGRALKLAPDEAEAWWARAEVLERTGNLSEALEAMKGAIKIKPQNPELWNVQGQMLERTNRNDEAYQSFTTAIELVKAKPGLSSQAQAKLYLSRSNFLKRQNRLAEAARDYCLAENIPLRDHAAKPEQLDLTLCYNASLNQSWHRGFGKSDFASLPWGIQTFAGVTFDLRGLIQVGRESRTGVQYAKQVEGIEVKRVCKRMHFLHAAIDGSTVKDGTQIGSYVIHYANDERREIPIVKGRDLADWYSQPNEENKNFVIAWTGTNEASIQMGRTIRLFKTTWENPSPEVAVKSIDFVGKDLLAAPFLVAITVE